MAGQPKKQAIIRELTERARVEIGDDASPLDYAVMWVESGKTLTALADSIAKAQGIDGIMREQVARWLHSLAPDAASRLDAARARGGHAMVETALSDTEALKLSEESAMVARQRLSNQERARIAAVWNPELREQRGANIAISINATHLDSLRIPEPVTARIANPSDAQIVEAEVIEAPSVAQLPASSGDSEVSAP